MTGLQQLLEEAYKADASRKRGTVSNRSKIQSGMRKRQSEKVSADYTGMGAAGSYGQMSLEDMIAKATGQESEGKDFIDALKNMLMGEKHDVGGGPSILEILRQF